MVYIMTDMDGRLTAMAAPGYHCGEGEIAVELPDDFDLPLRDWVYAGGMIVHDPLPEDAPGESMDERMEALEAENEQLKEALDLLLSGATEEV